MGNKDNPVENALEFISIEIDGKEYQVPGGYTLSTAITYAVGINYGKTNSGKEKGPVCNMGICYECSVFLDGVGYTRACMVKACQGMRVKTTLQVDNSTNEYSEKRSNNICGEGALKTKSFDLAIIGAGPGGLGTADELLEKGMNIVMIDEQQKAGGQIYRQPVDSKMHTIPINPLVNKIQNHPDIHMLFGASIWSIISIDRYGEICLSPEEHDKYRIYLDSNAIIEAKYLLIATGAYDRMLPFKGWDKPGIMSAGGLQILAKTQNFLPGKSTFLLGSHPFLLIVAQNIIKLGGKVEGIAFSQEFPKMKEMLNYGFNGLKKWKKSTELLSALKSIQKEKIPLYFNNLPIESCGNGRVESISIGELMENGEVKPDTKKIIPCDTIGVCYGFNASSELARQMQCQSYYDEMNGGWLIKTNLYLETNQPGVYAAGEITGVGGAELSEIEGRIVALSILSKIQVANLDESKLPKLLKERESWRKFARMLNSATFVGTRYISLLQNAPKTLICKCEEIPFQNIKEAIESYPHLSSLSSIKSITRCGMGLCQGRYCERSLLETTEKLLNKEIPKESFSSRYPIKPINISQFK